jgi:hypothetical protein
MLFLLLLHPGRLAHLQGRVQDLPAKPWGQPNPEVRSSALKLLVGTEAAGQPMAVNVQPHGDPIRRWSLWMTLLTRLSRLIPSTLRRAGAHYLPVIECLVSEEARS